MKIKHVILSSNSNKEYLDYWPICSRAWNEGIGIRPELLFVDKNPNIPIDDTNGDVIRVKATPKYSEFQNSSLARIWGILKYRDELCIVGDIDLIPLDKSGFTMELDPNAFTWLYNVRYTADNRYLICYFACTGNTLAKLFDVSVDCSLEEFIDAIINKGITPWNARRRLVRIKQSGYGIDEVTLTYLVDQAEKNGQLKVDKYPNKPFHRLWRGGLFPIRWAQWHKGVPMLDYHCHRPYQDNVDMINYICNKQFGWDLPVNGEVKPYKISKLEVEE